MIKAELTLPEIGLIAVTRGLGRASRSCWLTSLVSSSARRLGGRWLALVR
jgi:hypothetical protein